MSITIKTPEEIEKMRVAGRLASEVLDYIAPYVVAGVTTEQLDKLCHDYKWLSPDPPQWMRDQTTS